MLRDSGPVLRLRVNSMATDLASDITKPHFLHHSVKESKDVCMDLSKSEMRRTSLQIAMSSANRPCCEMSY